MHMEPYGAMPQNGLKILRHVQHYSDQMFQVKIFIAFKIYKIQNEKRMTLQNINISRHG